jgi:hypothetical protein
MNFKEFKESLKYKKYKLWKIITRYIEYKTKNLVIDILLNFNKFKINNKPIIDIWSYRDNRYINFLVYSLKDEFVFSYNKNKNTKKLFKRIGFINFFKNTIPNSDLKKSNIKINMKPNYKNDNEISIDTNYYKFFYNNQNEKKNNELVMPYFMYPRIYNSFYKKINIIKKPNFNLRVFFSGSIVTEGYSSFNWKAEPEKFPNRIKVINKILKEFEKDIFFIQSKKDLKTNSFLNKKIILCLHDQMIKKTSYTLNFENNFKLLSNSCFNLSCPGVVMPLCHHLIEGIKVGSIPITNCERLLFPNLNVDTSLQYSNLDELIEKIHEALIMSEDKILFMRSKVQEYYKSNLSPERFKENFKKIISKKNQKIICCDDHRSVNHLNY